MIAQVHASDGETVGVSPAAWSLDRHGSRPGGQPLPLRELTAAKAAVKVWFLGAHGGAGESTLAGLFGESEPAHHQWPLATPGRAGTLVVLCARTSFWGMTAAMTVAGQWDEAGLRDRVQMPVGLVLIADRPWTAPEAPRSVRAPPAVRHRSPVATSVGGGVGGRRGSLAGQLSKGSPRFARGPERRPEGGEKGRALMVKRMLTRLARVNDAARTASWKLAQIATVTTGTIIVAGVGVACAASSVIPDPTAKALPGDTGAEITTALDYFVTGVLILAVVGVLGVLAKMASAHHGGRSATEYIPALGVCLFVAAAAGSVGQLVGGIA